jgi:glycosyltransferase involved in cell wall biosynthesis
MDTCDFAISVSQWETFGRGIFESVSMGIPTLVYKRLSCVWEHLSDGRGIRGTENSPAAMADSILELARHPSLYRELSRLALLATRSLDESFVMQKVRAAWQRASAGACLEAREAS